MKVTQAVQLPLIYLEPLLYTYKPMGISWMQRLRNMLDHDFCNKTTKKETKQ